MTTAQVSIRNGAYVLEMEGHATYAGPCESPAQTELVRTGETVCAACSAIVYALAGYLANAGVHVAEMGESTMESGRVRLSCRGDASVEAAYRMAGIGLAQLSKAYPAYVRAHISEQ